MNDCNNGTDWCDLLALIIDIHYTSFESLLRDEQKVYSRCFQQRILEE